MKTILLLVVMSLSTATMIFSQNDASEKEKAIQEKLLELERAYHLTAEQQVEVRKFVIEYFEERAIIRTKDVTSYRELDTAYRLALNDLMRAVKTVLEPGQDVAKGAYYYLLKYTVESDRKVCITKNKILEERMEATKYRDEHIFPVLFVLRKQLEKQITEADKKDIIHLDSSFKEATYRLQKFREEHTYQFISNGLDEKSKEYYAQLRRTFQNEHEKIRALIAKYDHEMNLLFKEIAPKMEQWKKNLLVIEYKYFPRRRLMYEKRSDEVKARDEENYLALLKFDFLFLNPNQTKVEYKNTINVIGNPYGRKHTIELELEKAQSIKIELANSEKEVIRTILAEERDKGLNLIDIDFLDLDDGMYYYMLTIDGAEEISTVFKKITYKIKKEEDLGER